MSAGDEKDCINRQSYCELYSNEPNQDFTVILVMAVTLMVVLIITAITTLF